MDSLQFQKAEFSNGAPPCAACKTALTGDYYQLSAHNICPDCAEKVRKNQQAPSHAALMRGVLYGAGAAFACFLGYAAVIWFTGYQLGILAILIGYVVGRAVRIGTHGLGGLRCQIAAVALTYCAMAFSSLPAAIRDYAQHAPKQDQPKVRGQPSAGAGSLAVGIVLLSGFALISPFVGLADPASGILGLIIIGIGLQRAWRLTGRDSRPLVGPLRRELEASLG